MADVLTKTCPACGDSWQDGRHEGFGAGLLNKTDVLCGACIDAQDDEFEVQQEAQRRSDSVHRSGLPPRLQGVTFDGLDRMGNAEVFAAAQLWAAGELDGLVLHGEVGVGKTTLAAAAAWAKPRIPRWVSVPAMIAQAFGDQPAKEEVARTLTGRHPLVLDDIDKVKPGEWVAAQLFTAIDSRMTAGAPLLVTSNLRVSELADTLGGRFGEAIASRLAGYSELHEVVGRDRRLA